MSLPSGYKRLEYIQSSGTQYVDSGITINSTTYKKYRFLFDIGYPSISGSYWLVNGNSGSNVVYYFGLSNTGKIVYGNGTTDVFGSVTATTGRYLIDFNPAGGSYKFGDLQHLTGLTFNAPSGSQNFYLFAYNKGNGQDMHTERLYSAKIYDNGTIVRDFIPCQTTFGDIGLWDDVNSVFYGNAGTGTFTAGPGVAIAADASEITELEYIQSSGTQYVNSNFKANQNTRVVIDFEYISGDVVFGAYDTSGVNGFGLQAASNKWYIYYGTSGGYSDTSVVTNTRLVADVNKNVATLNGVALRTATINTFTGANPIIISGLYNASEPGFLTSLKIYSCQIYDNGTIVRDFIPCQKPDGTIGLWDDVNSVFYGNAGTGTFTAGPVLSPDAPSDLTSSVDDGTVTLSWHAVSGATGYKISRDSVLVSTQTVLTYTETVTKGQTYTYSVVAYNDYGDSDPATLSVNVPLVPPSTPSNFAASVSGLSATLSWDAPAKATGYRLYRDGVLLSDQTDTGYTDAVEPFVSYVYTLIAYNDDGESGQATVSVLVIIPPAAPQNFMVLYAGMKEISLSWSAVTGADSYELKRGGTTVYTGSDTAYTDSHLKPETGYTYSLTAINTAGISLEVTLETATTGLVLITDRTTADVEARNEKGTYKASDLNRVGAAMNYVADRLRAVGYDPHISPKTDWKDEDWVTPASQAVYLGDLAELRKQFAMMKSTPEVPPRILATGINTNDGLTYTWANDIERILEDVDALITNIMAGWFYSGELYAGEV